MIGKRTVDMNVSTVARTPYERLLLQFTPRAIRNPAQYQRVLRQVDRLMCKPKLTRAEDDLLELLASLVAQYEQTQFPAPDVTPGAMLAHLLQARSSSLEEVAAATAISTTTLARFLDDSHPIDATSRAQLANFFHVSANLFLSDE
jgi:HTH-type transcriptional regulator / antitoxin HigA